MDNKDLDLIVEKLKGITNSDFRYAQPEEFDNPELAKVVNDMINSFSFRNNHYLMRINDSMYKIADSSCVKNMLDEISLQRDPINDMQESVEFFSANKEDTKTGSARVYALSKQIKCWIEEFAAENDALNNRLEELLTNGKLNNEAAEEINGVVKDISYMRKDIESAIDRVRDMTRDLGDIYCKTEATDAYYAKMFDAVSNVTGSFDSLYVDCLRVGEQLYRISRDIDNARNDMFRNNSWPLLHDKLKVFTVDHFTLAWRLYNHAVEYETLRVTQVNNPDGCKFGLWAKAEMEKNTELSKSVEFKAAVDAHYEFHKYALECFLNKESYKERETFEAFEKALTAEARFELAIDSLHEYLNSIGIMDETEVWKFQEDNNIRKKL